MYDEDPRSPAVVRDLDARSVEQNAQAQHVRGCEERESRNLGSSLYVMHSDVAATECQRTEVWGRPPPADLGPLRLCQAPDVRQVGRFPRRAGSGAHSCPFAGQAGDRPRGLTAHTLSGSGSLVV